MLVEQMDKIPVMVQFEGKEYLGYFSQVMGGSSNSMFHLMVDGYYWGRLSFSEFANAWRLVTLNLIFKTPLLYPVAEAVTLA